MNTGNPYEPSGVQPLQPEFRPDADDSLAASKVSGPGIALIVVGVNFALLALWRLVSSTQAMLAEPVDLEAQLTPQQKHQLDQLEQQGVDPQMIMKFAQMGGIVGLVLSLVQVVVAGLVIIGGQKMKNLESRGMAMAAVILAMISCITPSLRCVNDAYVKSAFSS